MRKIKKRNYCYSSCVKNILKVKKIDIINFFFVHFYSSSNFTCTSKKYKSRLNPWIKNIQARSRRKKNKQSFKNLSKKGKKFASNIFTNAEIFTRLPPDILRNGSSISSESSKQCASLNSSPGILTTVK